MMFASDYLRTRPALQHAFQRLQVVLDRRLVLSELPVGHARLADKREHELAALCVGHDSHGVVDGDARLELDVMIQDAERVRLHESHPDLAERGVRNPLIAVPPDLGARQPCGPARQVPRVGGELVDLGRRASDGNADMQRVVHGTPCQMPQASALQDSADDALSGMDSHRRPELSEAEWVKPCEGNVREGRYLDESGQEERDPAETVRGEKAREEEGQGEWWSDENSEAGGAG